MQASRPRTLICPDASRQQYVEVCLATLLKITEILMNWCRTVARFIGLNSAIFGLFFAKILHILENRIRFLHLRNFWSVSRVDDVIHRSWHYFGILFPFLAIFKGFGGKNDGLRWYFLGLCLTSFSNTLATLKKVFVASWQHLGFKTYMSWRPA